MKQIILKVNSKETHKRASNQLLELFNEHKYLRVSVLPGKDRSAEQNRTWAAMYKQIWIQAGGEFESFEYARAYCKWWIGIPIMKRDFEGFQRLFDWSFRNVSHEQALILMNANPLHPKDGFPVTSNFGVKQGNEYIENIARHFSGLENELGQHIPKVDFSDILDAA